MPSEFPYRKPSHTKARLFGAIAAASLLLISAPALTRAQGQTPAPGFPPPGFGALPQPNEAGAGWLGVTINEVTADRAKDLKLPEVRGASVEQVTENSPAAKAGLQKGDVITEYNGQRVEGVLEFERFVRETPPGRTAKVAVWRGGKSISLSAVIGDAGSQAADVYHWRVTPNGPEGDFIPGPNEQALRDFQRGLRLSGQAPVLGASAIDLSGQLATYFGIPDGGILITDVRANSAAEKAGLQAGDVIAKLDGQSVHNLGELRMQLRAKRDAKTVVLTVIRKGSETTVTVTPDKPQPQGAGNGDDRNPL